MQIGRRSQPTEVDAGATLKCRPVNRTHTQPTYSPCVKSRRLSLSLKKKFSLFHLSVSLVVQDNLRFYEIREILILRFVMSGFLPFHLPLYIEFKDFVTIKFALTLYFVNRVAIYSHAQEQILQFVIPFRRQIPHARFHISSVLEFQKKQ